MSGTLTLQLAAVEARRAKQVVLEGVEAGPPVGGAAGRHATAAGAGGRGQGERAHASAALRPRRGGGGGGGGRGGGGRVVGVVDGGAQGRGQRRALGGDLRHRVGRVGVEALSHRLEDGGGGEEEEARDGRKEWRG